MSSSLFPIREDWTNERKLQEMQRIFQIVYTTNVYNPLCGPGFIGFYLLSSLALLLTWILHRRLAHSDTVNLLMLLSQVIPIATGMHQVYLVYYYPFFRGYMWYWEHGSIYAWNYAIQNNNLLCRFGLLLNLVVINPISSIRMQRRRILVMHQCLSVILLGYTVSELFRIQKGDRILYFPIGDGHWVKKWSFSFFYMSLIGCVAFGGRHVLILVPRSIRGRWQGRRVDYLAEEDWTKKEGWRNRWATALRRHLQLDLKITSVSGVVIYPSLALWLLGQRLVSDYGAVLVKKLSAPDCQQVSKLWLHARVALFVLFPNTNESIWEWKQLLGLGAGMVVLAYCVRDIWRSFSQIDPSKQCNELEKGFIEKANFRELHTAKES
jgi:hypothetical protein